MGISIDQYRLAIDGFHCVHFKQEFQLARFKYFSVSWIIQIYLCNHYMKQLLTLSGDIETNPGPVTPTRVLSCLNKSVITGNLHQGSLKFLASALGTNTCMANSLIALAYSQILEMSDWNSTIIDFILDVGKALYDKLYPNRKCKDSCPYLQVTDLNINFRVRCQYFTCSPGFSLFGYIGDTDPGDNIVYKLEHALEMAFDISSQAVLIIEEYGIALFKVSGVFHVFDSHSRNSEGYAHPDGHAVLVTLESIADLCCHLRYLVCTLSHEPMETIRFEVTPISLYQSNSIPDDYYDLSTVFDSKNNKRKGTHEESQQRKITKLTATEADIPQISTLPTTGDCYVISEIVTSKYTYIPTDITWQTEKVLLFLSTPPKHTVHFQGQGLSLGCPLTKDLVGDGNCFFRAISYITTGSEKYHGQIRSKIVQHLLLNKSKFEKILRVQGQTMEQYLQQSEIAMLGKFASEVEIVASAHFLKTDIFTYMINKRWLKYSGKMVDPHIRVDKKSIYLKHCNANHYQVVTKIKVDPSNSLENYFTSQKLLQDQHVQCENTTSTQSKLSKRQKQQLRKESARARMSIHRQIKTELDRQKTKEQDRVRKFTERSNRKEFAKEKDKEQNKVRKRIERSNKSELAKEKDKEQNKVRKRVERSNKSEFAKEKVKEQNKVRKRVERSNKSEFAKEKVKEQNKVRKRIERSNKSELAKEKVKEQNKVRKRVERSNKSEFAKEKVKEQNKVRKRIERSNKSEFAKEKVKEQNKVRKRVERSNKSEFAKDKDKEQNKVRKRIERSNKSEFAKDKDKEQNKVRKRIERSNKSEFAKDKDKEQNKVRKRIQRSTRKEVAKEKDKQQNKLRKRTKRVNRTDNQKQRDRGDDKARKKLQRFMFNSDHQELLQDFHSNPSPCHPAFEIILNGFFHAIRSGPTYSCSCCNRFMYKSAVTPYKAENFPGTDPDLLHLCLKDQKSEDRQWICKTCQGSLKVNRMPAQAVANNLEVEPVPEQLSFLCNLESQLITRIIPFMKIVALPTGGQHGLRGQVVLVPSNIQKTAETLPRQTSESQIIALSFKRRLSDKYSVKKQYIRPYNVNEALEYLKQNNPFYKNVITNSHWTHNSQLENPELWKAATEPKLRNTMCKPSYTSDENNNNAKSNDIQPKQVSKPLQDHDADMLVDSEEEVDDDNPDHVKTELNLKKSINSSTCLYPKCGPNVKTNQILHLSPGEGQRPTHVFYEKDWEALTFPTLFPSGTNTFNEERDVRITVKKYINARLLSSDTRFAESTEYTFQCLHWAETVDVSNSITMQLKKTRTQDLNAAKLKNPDNVRLMLKNDELFASFKKIRGTPQYWKEMQQDMIAKIRHFGPYTFFLSGSAADFHWPELVQVIATQYGEHFTLEEIEQMTWQTKRNWIARNPVTAARHIDYIFGKVWRNIILSGVHPIGQILNYDIRKEMQSRGTEHFHAAVHVLNAPILDKDTDEDVISFIDKYISCAIPDDTDPVLRDLVISRQTHHHTRTCKKRKGLECRFHFKKPPSSETVIARKETSKEAITKAKKVMTKVMKTLENSQPDITLCELLTEANVSEREYHSILTLSLKRTSVILKRKPSETSINPYNPFILKALRANMDIQYITDVWACIAYITSYMCKPEREMSELMRNAVKEADTATEKLKSIGNTFLKCREVSQHEAIARLVGLPLRQTNTTVQYVPTGYEEERTRMLKSVSELDEMDDDSENVYVPSILDKYAARPHQLNNLSLAEFASMYSTSYGQKSDFDNSAENLFDNQDDAQNTKPKSSTKLKLLQGVGWIYKRQKEIVIRYYYVSKKKDSEKYYHRLLILYLPWRKESQLKLNNSYEAKFVQVHDTIKDTIKKFEPCNDEVQHAYENAPDPDDIDEELWDSVAPPEAEQCRDRQISDDAEYDLLDPSNLDQDQVSVNPINVTTSLNSKRSVTLQAKILANVKYYKIVRSLNDQQRRIHDFIFSWCTSYRIASILGNSLPDPFYVFLTGGAGVGKSHAVHAIFQSAIRQLRREGESPDTPTIILTASTVLTIPAQDTKKDLHTSRAKVIVTSKNPHETAGLRDEIKIAVGARYMHTKNTDLSDGLVNGATGEITHIEIDQHTMDVSK
ncbi:uncharacterized protein [Ptychodera flava]|uniref:uncharacterized protein n=1 Tax=Ptychodera flava TaxID=63121 RepID=UPI00396A7FA6